MLSIDLQYMQLAEMSEFTIDKAYWFYKARQARGGATALTRLNYEVRAIMYGHTSK